MTRASLLVFSRDPGGTGQLIALLEALRRQGMTPAPAPVQAALGDRPMAIFARGVARDLWRRAGVEAEDWDQACPAGDIARLCAEHGVGAILTGTSDVDEPTDRALWRYAADQRTPSAAILDHEANMAARFHDAQGWIWPDLILAPDAACADAVLAAGAPEGAVIRTPDFRAARLARSRRGGAPDRRAAIRRSWGCAEGERAILFASECGREMQAAGRVYPYDEIAMLDRLGLMLAQARGRGALSAPPDAIWLVIRPHPRDIAGKYAAFQPPPPLRVAVDETPSPEDAILAADVIVGMQSTLLLDAATLGVSAVSLTSWDRLDAIQKQWTAAP